MDSELKKVRKSRAKTPVEPAIQEPDRLLTNGPPPPVIVRHTDNNPDDPPPRLFSKSTFNTHDIMHAPVEKTIQMLDKI
ncbi:MAG: hypothetical protein AAB738_02455, partial [Patescibacteria group bacterium]